MDLYNDFTYFLDDPVQGDQFLQKDRRISHRPEGQPVHGLAKLAGHDMDNTIGVQIRNDNIPPVGLYNTEATQVLADDPFRTM